MEPELTFAGQVAFMRFVITGDPVAKGRPRTRVVTPTTGGKSFAQIYTDPATRSWEETVGWQVRQQLASWAVDPSIQGELKLPVSRRVIANLRFNVRRPKSLPKRVEYPLTRPDVDNLAKAVLDALQVVQVIKDDNIITDMNACKRFEEDGHPQGVEVELTVWLDT